jgi:hypothetical protein
MASDTASPVVRGGWASPLRQVWYPRRIAAESYRPVMADGWEPIEDHLGSQWGPKPKLRVIEPPPWSSWTARSEAARAIRWLGRLKQIVTWAGRYPAPLKLSDASPWPRRASDADFNAIERICERLEAPAVEEDEDYLDYEPDADDIGD